MVMTSVSGHLLAHDFKLPFRKWLVLGTPSWGGVLSSSAFNPELSGALRIQRLWEWGGTLTPHAEQGDEYQILYRIAKISFQVTVFRALKKPEVIMLVKMH